MGVTFKGHRRKNWPNVVGLNVHDFSSRLFRALGQHEMLSVGFGKDYLKLEPDFSGSVSDFSSRWLCFNLLRKFPGLKTGIDTRKVAMETFDECERKCEETNTRLLNGHLGLTPGLANVFHVARGKIRDVLGRVPDLQQLDFRFGPGASLSCRKETSVYNKMSSPLTMTYQMRSLFQSFSGEFPHWIVPGQSIDLVHGSELTFVPKSAKTDRPICIEPLLNGLCQKGIGTYLKKRLAFRGVNLLDQGVNQRLAANALKLNLATVDLSSASDLISFGLVFQLLPIEWVELLDSVRSHRYFSGGAWREFHKFSSMGNAFTFELETLIFWSICHGVCEHLGIRLEQNVNFSVYGDDIILPSEAMSLLTEALTEAGFLINSEKSFWGEHPFRESCGKDFYLGCDITPFKIKSQIRTVVDLNWLANSLRRWITENRPFGQCEKSLISLYWWVRNHIPSGAQFLGPVGYGDGHLHVDWDEARPNVLRAGRGIEGYWFFSYVEAAKPINLKEWPTWYPLYFAGIPEALASKGYTVRGRVIKKVQRILCHDWQSNGPVP